MILLDTNVWCGWFRTPANYRESQCAKFAKRNAKAAALSLRSPFGGWPLLFANGRPRASGTVEASIREIVDSATVTVLEITSHIAGLAMAFPETYPKDPGERLIGATARALGLTLIMQDKRILASPLIRSIW